MSEETALQLLNVLTSIKVTLLWMCIAIWLRVLFGK